MSSHADASFLGDDFGQRVDLCVRIREVLAAYPESSVLLELLQNADDAGARTFEVVLDHRSHAQEGLAYPGLAPLQGPALMAFNDAVFTEADWASIQRIGDSLKRENSGGTKTGRYGLGFNSVYAITDVPSFASGTKLAYFDPQCTHLPAVDPSNPGKLIDWSKPAGAALVSKYPNQFAPWTGAFGCNFTGTFAGTLFRLPLRTEAAATTSRISSLPATPGGVRALLRTFASEAGSMLLFLKHVETITISEWTRGQAQPTRCAVARVSGVRPELRAARAFVVAAAAAEDALIAANSKQRPGSASNVPYAKPQPRDFALNIEEEQHSGFGDDPATDSAAALSSSTSKWLICTQLGGGTASSIAAEPVNRHLRLVPFGGIAARLSSSSASDAGAAVTGKAYVFLPLPIATGLPVHVNGYLEVSSNRRDLWTGADLAGEGAVRAQWNSALLTDVIGPCYARAVDKCAKAAAAKQLASSVPTSLLPCPASLPGSLWSELTRSVYRQLATLPVLPLRSGSELAQAAGLTTSSAVNCLRAVQPSEWVSPDKAVLLASDDYDDEGGATAEVIAFSVPSASSLELALRLDGVPVTVLSSRLVQALVTFLPSPSSSSHRVLSPQLVVQHLHMGSRVSDSARKQLAAGLAAIDGGSPEQRARAVVAVHACIVAAHPALAHLQLAHMLLRYVTSMSLSGADRGSETAFGSLVGLPLLPQGDGSLTLFRRLPTQEEGRLAQKLSVLLQQQQQRQGSIPPLQRCLAAVEAAIEFVGPATSPAARAEREASILEAAASIIQQQQQTGLSFIAAEPAYVTTDSLVRSLFEAAPHLLTGAAAGSHDEPVTTLLSSAALQKYVAVRTVTPSDLFLRLLPRLPLPSSASSVDDGGLVEVRWDPSDACFGSRWLASVWQYMRQACMDEADGGLAIARQSGIPLLPTTSGTLISLPVKSGSTSIAPLASVDCSTAAAAEVALISLGVRILSAASLQGDGATAATSPNDNSTQHLHPLLVSAGYVRPSTLSGVLQAVGAALAPPSAEDRMTSLPPPQRQALLRWICGISAGSLQPAELALLKLLPIHRVCRTSSDIALSSFTSLTADPSPLLLAEAPSLPEAVLAPHGVFLRLDVSDGAGEVSSAELLPLYRSLGVTTISLPQFYSRYLLPQPHLGSLPSPVRDRVLLRLLSELPSLARAMPELVGQLANSAFVPVAAAYGGADQQPLLKRPCDLHDPSSPQLRALLGAEHFPAPPFDGTNTEEGGGGSDASANNGHGGGVILSSLRQLGLSTTLTREALLASARSVERLVGDGMAQLTSSPSAAASASDTSNIATALPPQLSEGLTRSSHLFTYVNSHAEQLLAPPRSVPPAAAAARSSGPTTSSSSAANPSPGSMFARLGNFFDAGSSGGGVAKRGAVSGGPSAEQQRADFERAEAAWRVEAAQAEEFAAQLRTIAWLPVHLLPPHPTLPWPAGGQMLALSPVASPSSVRSRDDAWLCSAVQGYRLLHMPQVLQAEGVEGNGATITSLHVDVAIVMQHSASHGQLPPSSCSAGLSTPSVSTHLTKAMGWDQPLSPTAAAAQLVALAAGVNSTDSNTFPPQLFSTIVPQLYRLLDRAVSARDSSSLLAEVQVILQGQPWVWVGEGDTNGPSFVKAESVCLSPLPFSARPYLFSVPPSLAHQSALLTALGVRQTFGPTDYASVLRRLFSETRNQSESQQPAALSPSQLDLALSLVQRLSDAPLEAADLDCYVPDAQGVMAPARECCYDDAPWLNVGTTAAVGIEEAGEVGLAAAAAGGDGSGGAPSSFRFVHPKMSNKVAAAVGCASLRHRLLATSASLVPLGVPSESFGQAESLTRRLRHILELYSEGPSTLFEFVQNADDAGASTVKILFNLRSYGTSSLLSPKMADWQGPAVYVYNDAAFSQRDFTNLARIGQASKLDRLETTGRFGLGFNSCYHFSVIIAAV